jgi:hypothetical protein
MLGPIDTSLGGVTERAGPVGPPLWNLGYQGRAIDTRRVRHRLWRRNQAATSTTTAAETAV